MARHQPILIKKYSNRRLYDANASRYVTLAEVEAMIHDGADVQVVDANSGRDLTQPTLVQILLDSRGASDLLPAPLLLQLIRLGDDALSEFLGRWVAYALDLYLQARHGAAALMPFNPLAAPFTAAGGAKGAEPPDPPAAPPPPALHYPEDSMAALRREVEDLKKAVRGPKPRKKAKKKRR